MADIAIILALHELMDLMEKKTPQRKNKKMSEKGKLEGIL